MRVKAFCGHMASPDVGADAKNKPVLDRTGLQSWTRHVGAVLFLLALSLGFLSANSAARADNGYTAQEIVDAGHGFFGATTGGLATVVEKVFASYGLPNGYVLGEEASGAFVGGLIYGEGNLYTKNAGDHRVFWQGPSIGWDFGGNGSRVMILVYNLNSVDALYKRYAGVAGSAYLVAGLGFNALKNGNMVLVPIRTGVGARLGVNLGYLKLTRGATWNPF